MIAFLRLSPPVKVALGFLRWLAPGAWVALLTLTAAQPQPPTGRPQLFFREDFKESSPATPITQEHIAHAELHMNRLGPGEARIRKSHHDRPADDPYYVWSGETERPWAFALRHRGAAVDLTGTARIRWRAKQTGFRQLRIVLKLADGKWVISDQFDDESSDWRVREFIIADLRWRAFDPAKASEGRWVPTPDLSRVDEVGFTDLMPGGGTPASSRLDWIEVYGRAVPR